jgi:hypothetical protein
MSLQISEFSWITPCFQMFDWTDFKLRVTERVPAQLVYNISFNRPVSSAFFKANGGARETISETLPDASQPRYC